MKRLLSIQLLTKKNMKKYSKYYFFHNLFKVIITVTVTVTVNFYVRGAPKKKAALI